ncbi:LysR substrate-binding domain-containing protein [Shewanella colwelliana]|uniref:LysR substrate-binding domain-containing protein n=1 Tax=Shewanella colwelliana TaxID=23 RepID=UPI0022B02172|nr:LysR substrate-binding domain-containing protein [Shewanella colwelliana]MCZ4339275.1 LysR substrate-binding domain-containing protein [Shewanella colwelliana]
MGKRLRNLNNLLYFEAAVRLGSYSKAGQEYSVTQAAVSQKMRQLEGELNCKLFIRKGREMVPTLEGARLYQHVYEGLVQIDRGLSATQAEPVEGGLSVATTPAFASRWLMPRLWKFSKDFPEIHIRIKSCLDPKIDLSTDNDIAIGELSYNRVDTDIIRELLFNEPVFPVCSTELARDIGLTKPAQLLDCWLIKGFHNHHFSWEEWFKKAKVDTDNHVVQWMEVETFDMGLNTIIAGHGVCLSTDCLAGDFIERGLLVKPFDIHLSPGIEYSVIHHINSIRKARISVFIRWLKQEAKIHSFS